MHDKMKSKIKLCCTENRCNKKFDLLQKLNQHIAKTGHNNNKKVSKSEALRLIGVKSLKITIHA